jgi:outer membrane protein assembly factor BamB
MLGRGRTSAVFCVLSVVVLAPGEARLAALRADDWPQWLGPQRDGVWRETGILETLPPTGLKVRWRVPIGPGYSGPVVASGRVYVMDRQRSPEEVERVLCFAEETGQPLWTYAYPCSYRQIGYASGPRASPTVHQGKVYTLGATGRLLCLDAARGDVIWGKDLVKEYKAQPPRWGISAAPLVEGGVLIVCAGGEPDACVLAFNKDTGQEVWKALPDRPSYSAPIAVTAGGKRQIIVWTGDSVASLEPGSGKLFWQVPFKLRRHPLAVATPVLHGDFLLIVSFENGSKLLKLDRGKPAASVVWETKLKPNSLMGTPVFQGDHFYVADNYGELQCLEASTGRRVWGTRQPTGESQWGESVHLTPQGNRVFLLNDQGQLIVAQLSAQGYKESSRVALIEPTVGAKEERAVAWAHPAYANKHILVRNDKELLRASLAAERWASPDGVQGSVGGLDGPCLDSDGSGSRGGLWLNTSSACGQVTCLVQFFCFPPQEGVVSRLTA